MEIHSSGGRADEVAAGDSSLRLSETFDSDGERPVEADVDDGTRGS